MSGTLSKSPERPERSWRIDHSGGGAQGASGRVLAEARWAGVELLLCREDIHRLTHWSIHQPANTIIVHLGGKMRRLQTEIEGSGAHFTPPSPGDIWLVPAGHRYSSEALGQVITYAELRIEPDAEVELTDTRIGQLEHLQPRMAHRDDFLYHSVAQLARLSMADDDVAGMMSDRLQHVLRQHLFREYREMTREARAARPRLSHRRGTVRSLGTLIDERLGDRLTLVDLANHAGLSVHELLVAFRASFGTTPAQYILSQRLARARWLLLHTDQDISDVAMATGFSSHSHFSAAFRRREGVSPGQLRAGRRGFNLG